MRPEEQVESRLHRDGRRKSIQVLLFGDAIPFGGKHILQFVANTNTSAPPWGFRGIGRTFDLLILDTLFHLLARRFWCSWGFPNFGLLLGFGSNNA